MRADVGLGSDFSDPAGPFVFGPSAGTIYLGLSQGLFRTSTGGQ